MKLEIYASSTTDLIRESLQNRLSTKQLVEFAISFGDDLTDGVNFLKLLKKELDKIDLSEFE
jgi:hypothetical protein